MVIKTNQISLLWALQSSCNLFCRYCYFSDNYPDSPKGDNDLQIETILNFITKFEEGLISRVFIAGGEPLLIKSLPNLIKSLKTSGCKIIICTNGLPLTNARLSTFLCEYVDAVSISLDSHEAEYNDYWRVDKSRRGWSSVVEGIKTLLFAKKNYKSNIKIGVYTVLTKMNLYSILETAKFISNLGVDYYVVQPVSLPTNHYLFDDLVLTKNDYSCLEQKLSLLQNANFPMKLPPRDYFEKILKSVMTTDFLEQQSCFGGRELYFIKPDGTVWDCPSTYKIANTPQNKHFTIIGQKPSEIFKKNKKKKCLYFSQDCVNMWALMAFDKLLAV